ncbi:MAG: hypothetical protein F4236_04380 [Acidimicrobiia bacterium]|nr:hypothetical protein [Acidimicrobiia bacterium]MYE67410.1 hypothetical protein [Acidimicrobiia bacterium]
METDALTMTVLVPDNDAAPTVVFDDNAALKLAVVERTGAKYLNKEWDIPGLYILIDLVDADSEWGVYVGKAPAGIRARIWDHLKKKDHWYRALLVRRDTTHGFNSAQIGWLEGKLYDLLQAAQNARLSNKVRPGDETLAPYDRSALEAILVSLQRVLRLIGHDPSSGDEFGETASAGKGKKSVKYFGVSLQDLFHANLIKAGDDLESTNRAWPARAKISPEGSIVFNEKVFDSPSSAAMAVKDGPANGWDFWAIPTATGLVRLSTLREHFIESQGQDVFS